MALEDLTGAKYLDSLVAGNPVSNDDRREGDDHIRGIKNVLRNTFPNVNGAVSATEEQLNAAAAVSGGHFPGNVVVDGSLGVGIGAPATRVHVSDPAGAYVTIDGGTGSNFRGLHLATGTIPVADFHVQPDTGELRIAAGFAGFGGFQAFYTNGVERMRLDAAGNVGIGVLPASTFGVGTTWGKFVSSGSQFNVSNGVVTPFEIVHRGNGGFDFYPAGTLAMRIDAAGNVGIGGGAPAFPLDVRSAGASIRIAPSSPDNGALLRLTNSGGSAFVGLDSIAGGLGPAFALNVYHAGAFPIVFSTAGAERMRIDAAGTITQKNGLAIASDPGAVAGTIPIGGMVIAGAPGGTIVNGGATINAATTNLTLFATGAGVNGTVNAGTFRNCGALSSASTVALWVRTA